MLVTGKPLDSVGNAGITLGKLLGLKMGAFGPSDTVGIGDKVGSALDTGSNVELPTGFVDLVDALGS